jgi:hypothetical protein
MLYLIQKEFDTPEARLKVFTIALCMIASLGTICHAQLPTPGRGDTTRHLIIRLGNDYTLLDTALKELEGDIKGFPSTTLNLSAVSRDTEGFRLISIEVRDDVRLLGSHIYTPLENDALAAGGRHELYQGEAREGNRQLRVTYYWAGEDMSPQKGEVFIPLSVSKGMGYFIELFLVKSGEQAALHYTQFEVSNR